MSSLTMFSSGAIFNLLDINNSLKHLSIAPESPYTAYAPRAGIVYLTVFATPYTIF